MSNKEASKKGNFCVTLVLEILTYFSMLRFLVLRKPENPTFYSPPSGLKSKSQKNATFFIFPMQYFVPSPV